MGIFNKNTTSLQTQQKTNSHTHTPPVTIEPFTILVGGQFNIFISTLASDNSNLLTQTEKEAFHMLWYNACIDIDGFGNNIWCLKKGNFEIYNKEGIIVRFEKRDSKVKDSSFEEGRADFAYQSKDGNIAIRQNDRNKKVFFVYVSEELSTRLQKALRIAEAKALDIQLSNEMTNNTSISETTERKRKK